MECWTDSSNGRYLFTDSVQLYYLQRTFMVRTKSLSSWTFHLSVTVNPDLKCLTKYDTLTINYSRTTNTNSYSCKPFKKSTSTACNIWLVMLHARLLISQLPVLYPSRQCSKVLTDPLLVQYAQWCSSWQHLARGSHGRPECWLVAESPVAWVHQLLLESLLTQLSQLWLTKSNSNVIL